MCPSNARRATLLGGVALCALCSAQAVAQSLPTGGSVTAGNVAISQPSATSMLINQSSATGIIGWQSFSIGAGDQVRFENGAGMTLNRVNGNVPSSINGLLSASGSVYLVNPAGVTVGANGIVKTGGSFVASTLDVSDKNFLAGGDLKFSGNSQAAVVNLGKIGSSNGDIFLIARTVQNDGVLSAKKGTVGLASGSEVIVTDGALGNGKIVVRLPANGGEVKNRGRIRAAEAELRANGGNVLALAGNTKSIIKATGVANKGGRIFLTAEGGSVTTTQKIVARRVTQTASHDKAKPVATGGDIAISGDSVSIKGPVIANGRNGGAGGTIIVTGNDLTVGAGALIDASGKVGGTILIGGDRAGGTDPSVKFITREIANAQNATVESGATIRANGSDGKGGNIVVWSDGTTSVAGTFGATGNGGGFVETSGHVLSIAGVTVNAGKGGAWLLDPYDLTIDNSAGSSINGTLSSGTNVILETTATGTTGPGTPNASGNGDIIVVPSLSLAWNTTATLTMSAYRDIVFGDNSSVTTYGGGAGNLVLRADNTGTGVGTVQFLGNTRPQPLFVNGSITIFYNPTGDSTTVNATKYTAPTQTDFAAKVFTGSATPTSYMLVNTVYDLQNIQNNLSATYALGRDIDASVTASWNAGAGFAPIGTFTGWFDGLNQTIGGLTINRPTTSNVGLFGVYTGNGTGTSVIQNVNLTNANIRGWDDVGAVVGEVNSGGNTVTLSNLSATGTVTGENGTAGGLIGYMANNATLSNSWATATVANIGNFQHAGGLVGGNNGLIRDSWAGGAVSATAAAGGLVGNNSNSIVRSYATGSVTGAYAGGLVGNNSVGSITQSYATGPVSGASSGGLLGQTQFGSITNSYWDTYSTGQAGGIGTNVGNSTTVTALNDVTSDPGQSGAGNYAYKQTAYANFTGPGFTTTPGASGWYMIEGQTRPFGAWEYSTTIRNSHQLQLANMDLNADYTLGRNIDLGPDLKGVTSNGVTTYPSMWSPVGFVPLGTDGFGDVLNGINGFAGAFDGRGKVISNLIVNPGITGGRLGLIGFARGPISNVGIVDGSVNGNAQVGGLVGYTSGAVTNSYFIGTIVGQTDVGGLIGYSDNNVVTNSYASGTVTGGNFSIRVGGLIGRLNGGTVQESYSTAAVSGLNRVGGLVGYSVGAVQGSYSTGSVSGSTGAAGGLVGWNDGTIQRSYAAGAVIGNGAVGGLAGVNSSGAIQQSYATGAAAGNNQVGGLVGRNENIGTINETYSTGAVTGATEAGGLVGRNDATVTASYWDTQTSGLLAGIGAGTTTGATGLTSAQFRTASNFAGWTFTTTPGDPGWVIVNGDGTFNNAGAATGATRPFLASEYTTNIVNTHQLQLVALAPGASYTLGASIEAARDFAPMNGQFPGGPLYPGMWDAGGFVPIGTNTGNAFSGTFDGQNNYIAGLTINRPASDTVGLFGYVCNCGSISNLGLIDATVTGRDHVGALAGVNFGTMTNTYAIAPLLNSLTGDATGTVTGRDSVGGLVGVNGGSITNSYTGNQVNAESTIGGLVGLNSGAITRAYSTSTVFDNTATGNATSVGGLVGLNLGSIDQTWASGAVIVGPLANPNGVGGLVGYGAFGTITNSYFDQDATGVATGLGSGVGTVTALDASTAFTQASYGALNFGTDWYMIDGQTRPFLRNEFSTSIATPHQLQLVAMDLTASYKLVRDIAFATPSGFGPPSLNPSEMWGPAGFVPLGTDGNDNVLNGGRGFTGTFDGRGRVIENVVVDRPFANYAGLFGVSSGTVRNVGLEGGVVTGINAVGGLIGYNTGNVEQSYATASVTGNSFVGGLIGFNNGTTSTVRQSYATGVVDASGTEVGGLIGRNDGTVWQSYAVGAVSGGNSIGGLIGLNNGTVGQSYATGAVTGGSDTGGLVGTSNGTVTASYWDSYTTGQTAGIGNDPGNAGVVEVTSDPLQSGSANYAYKQTAYSNFSFTSGNAATGWFLVEGQTRPFGQWEYSTTIRNSHQLQLMSMAPAARYALGRDIDLYADLADPAGMWTATGFVPVGTPATPFSGGLDGRNRVISGLLINQTTGSNLGLFGVIGSTGVVHDLGIKDAFVSGQTNVGTLAGTNNGFVVNSYAAAAPCGCGDVVGAGSALSVGGLIGENTGRLNFVHADVYVTALDAFYLGGLVGYASGGAISNSYATGSVLGDPTLPSSAYTGGLIGQMDAGASVANSHASGDVQGYFSVGGLIGNNYGAVTNSFASGNVAGAQNVGGLVGSNQNSGTLTRVFATGSVSGDMLSSSLGGLIGNNNGTVTDAYATGAVQGGDTSGGSIGGLIGANDGDLTNVYATGWVSAASGATPAFIGALIGQNFGNITNAAWNTETSGQTGAIGVSGGGIITNLQALTTAQLQAALPAGFDSAVWGLVPGISYPYLNWRFPSGPTVVSGTATGIQDGNAGLLVGLAINGAYLGTQVTGANGYYHFMTDPQAAGGGALTWLTTERFGSSTPVANYSNAVGQLTALAAPTFTQGHATRLDLAADRILVRSDLGTLTDIFALMQKAQGDLGFGFTLPNPNVLLYAVVPGCGCDPGLDLLTAPATSLRIENGPTALTLDRGLNISGNLEVIAGGALTVGAVEIYTQGSILMTTPGTLTLAAGAYLAPDATGNAAVLSARTLDNQNDGSLGATVDPLPGGRWLIYLDSPTGNTFGDLDSQNTAIWNATYPALPPVAATGNRYVFAYQPTATFTADSTTKTYGDGVALTYSVSGLHAGVAGAFRADTATDVFSGTPSLTSPGETTGAGVAGSPYTITTDISSLTALSGYALAAANGTLTVTPRAITVTADGQSKIYGDADPLLTYLITSGNLVGSDTLSGALARVAGENVGGYAINQNTLANANYTITYVGANLTITPRAITVAADGKAKIYGDADPALTYQITAGNLVGSDALSGALARAAGENVGGYAINQNTLAASSNYTLTYVGANLTITPRAITVTADGKAKIYGDADPALTYQITAGNLVGSDALSGALARTAGENVGAYAINQNTLAASSNYALTYVAANLTINQRAITVTADGKSKVYGDSDPALTYQVTSGTLVGADTLSGALARAAGENVGAYAINQNTLAASSNYALTYVGANLTINQRAITVTADGKAKIYGDADPALTYQVTSGNLVGSDALSGALARTAGENVGGYAINQNTLAASSNYALTYGGANLTINQRAITIMADAKSKVYGTADPALTYQVTSGNLVGSDTLSGALARAAGENVGGYAIARNTLAASANYALTYVGANLAITPAPLLIAANDAARLSGQPNPPFSATITGLVAGDTPGVISGLSLTSPANTASPPGNYAILAAGATASNYTISFKDGVLTVKESGPVPPPPPPPFPTGLVGTYFQILLTKPAWPVNEPPADGSTTECTAPPLGGGCAGLPHPDNRYIGNWIIFAGP